MIRQTALWVAVFGLALALVCVATMVANDGHRELFALGLVVGFVVFDVALGRTKP